MTYYLDLSPYSYTSVDVEAGINSVNIGWLAKTQPFTSGTTSKEFQEELLTYCCKWGIHYTLGYHLCPFCRGDKPVQINFAEEIIWLGNGEIRVMGKSVVYAAPILIYHYVVKHNYRPPDEFIEAVLTGPSPGSEKYQALIKKLDKAGFDNGAK